MKQLEGATGTGQKADAHAAEAIVTPLRKRRLNGELYDGCCPPSIKSGSIRTISTAPRSAERLLSPELIDSRNTELRKVGGGRCCARPLRWTAIFDGGLLTEMGTALL
jgi:hypothetical protein